MLYITIDILTDNNRMSIIAAVLFSVHPIHTEAVSGVVGRAELTAGFCYLLCVILWCMASTRSGYKSVILILVVCAVGTIGILFKEQGITALGLCVCYEVLLLVHKNRKCIPHYKDNNNNNNKLILIRVHILIVSILVILYGRWLIMNREAPIFKWYDNPAAFANHTLTRVLNYNYLYFMNAWLLINPWMLCFDWSMGCIALITDYTDSRNLYSILLWVLLLLLVIRAIYHTDIILVQCMLAILIPYLPASNVFIRVGFVIAERVLYIPSMGYCWLIAIGMHRILQQSNSKQIHRVWKCILTILLVVYSVRSWVRSTEWTTEYKLYMSGIAVCPNNAKVHYNIGKVLADRGEGAAAEGYYREAIRLYPMYDQALNNLGNLLRERGQLADAEMLLSRAVVVNPEFAAGWMNLGIVQADNGLYSQAEQSYVNAIKLRNNYPDAYYNLGI